MDAAVHVSAVSSWTNTFDEDLALWEVLGVGHVGLASWKLEPVGALAAARRAADRGLQVSSVLARGFDLADRASWPAHHDHLRACVEAARIVGCPTVSLLTGRNLGRTWAEHVDLFAAATADARTAAADASVMLALEHTYPLRADVGFVYTVRDAVHLARQLGMHVCVDLNPGWAERGVEETLAGAVRDGVISVVQVSDNSLDTRCTGQRLVPGDGIIPLERLLASVLRNGYLNAVELEIFGPAIEAEGYAAAITRGRSATAKLVARAAEG